MVFASAGTVTGKVLDFDDLEAIGPAIFSRFGPECAAIGACQTIRAELLHYGDAVMGGTAGPAVLLDSGMAGAPYPLK